MTKDFVNSTRRLSLFPGVRAGATSASSQRGVALVITLILLSIITFMAVTFLVVSRHGAEQITATTQQVVAKDAARAATEHAIADIVARMYASTNGFNFGLLVSTNFQSAYFDPAQPNGTVSITNVSYNYANGTALSQADRLKMLNNQLLLPRPPVFITTNQKFPPEFRFYLDLNRNGLFESNGPVVVIDQFGNPTINYVGDPEWIGVLQHPDQPHSRSNLYIARWTVVAVPVGNTLDIDYIHNHANTNIANALLDAYLRDQGAGTWEISLAGFLNGLNSNVWDYAYNPLNGSGTSLTTIQAGGNAAADANSIFLLRNNGNLAPFASLYPWAPTQLFANSGIDGYSSALLSFATPVGAPNNASLPWSGADNTNHFFTSQDLFNPINLPNVSGTILGNYLNTFAAHLSLAGLAGVPPNGFYNDTNYGRYTMYRLLAQMGMDTAPEDTNKLNLNFKNVDGFSATNFISWADSNPLLPATNALAFFTNAVDRLLKTDTNFIITLNLGTNVLITNLSSHFIPIYPLSYYTPAVHRMLQVAANIYDATVDKTSNQPGAWINPGVYPSVLDYPSVFRPTFGVTNFGTNPVIFINGYVPVGSEPIANSSSSYYATNYALPDDLAVATAAITGTTNPINIYGAPWVIGAKKGLPNFNQISMQTFSQITRKLQIVKPSLSADRTTWHTNVQYIVGVSNEIGVQAWNSYLTTFSRPVHIVCVDNVLMNFTNENGVISTINYNYPTNFAVSNWMGYPAGQGQANPSQVMASFRIPMLATIPFLPDAVYHPANDTVTPVANYGANIPFDTTVGYPLPQFGLNVTNRMRFVIVDDASSRVLDYVELNGMNAQRNLTAELMSTSTNQDFGGHGGVWVTNRIQGSVSVTDPLDGILYQVQASLQNPPYYCPDATFKLPITANDWANMQYPPANFSTVASAVQKFSDFYNKNTNANSQLSNQVPYTPTRQVSAYYTWQANDPLVHYTLEDLTGLGDLALKGATNYTYTNLVAANIQRVNDRYMPWGSYPNLKGGNPLYNTDMSLKDPNVTRSDDWQFPTNKFPNIGWLGRVHRGTPWQTIYMKPTPVSPIKWQNWTGNGRLWSGNIFVSDAAISQPTNDWAIFDLFTAAINDNATRGQLSINQTNFAAWAAIFDGVIAATNPAQNTLTPLIIDPYTNAAALQFLINGPLGINAARAARTTNGQVFTRLGDILSAPALTVASPFLNTNDTTLNDQAYERLPQQVMSLLRVGSPRYVIYAYGQSLKPADHSLQIGGPYYGTCTNYQITGEVVTRAVVRFEPSQSISPTDSLAPLNPTRNPAMPQSAPVPSRAVIESFNILPPE